MMKQPMIAVMNMLGLFMVRIRSGIFCIFTIGILTMNGVTNRISVGPVVVRRISVSASHLRFKEACRKLQGVFIKDPTKK